MNSEPRKTVLHSWHVEHNGKMVDFAGWEMPVQYETGALQEHLATRRKAGLFDVSHMGRFSFTGPGAEAFLSRVLSNNAAALRPGEAQYTFIAKDDGGAVDDTYLYRLAPERFLLVVNAANRAKDWDWLRSHLDGADCAIEDVSEKIAMMSLQGPASQAILEEIFDKRELPENKRNRLSVIAFGDREVMVGRTGYTGEAVCFELFPPREAAVELWQTLVDHGAVPAGLGARDSLRLEAGLPLYGHELGPGPEGEIPIFANAVATAGVRMPGASGNSRYVGQAALEHQREELARIRRREIQTPPAERTLEYLIQPIAVFGSKKPLRQGFKLYLEGEEVGVVTSGTSVPSTRFEGRGLTAAPIEHHDLRPIGLALLRSDIRYRSDRPITLEVEDARGNRFEAELVEKNLWPSAPYTRPYEGFRAPPATPVLEAGDLAREAKRLAREARANTRWRRRQCVNLIPSEQTASRFVESLCIADPAGRYNEHNRLKSLGPDAPDVRYYKGTRFIMDKEEELKAALRAFFGCSQVEARVISGQMANDTVYDALKQFRNRHRRSARPRLLKPVLVHDLNKGGHLSAQVAGALKNYVGIDETTGRAAVEHFPMLRDSPWRIDVEATKEIIARTKPDLLVLGRSVIVNTEPVREIADFIHAEFGRDNPERPVILYDGAHVLGLIGEHFQKPLQEGADFVTGSTHKTFFGPQRGVVLSNIEPGSAFEELWGHIEQRAFPGHVSNHHLGTLLGLLGATLEMLAFKDDYPRQVIANAKALAAALEAEGLVIEGDPAIGHTETHQVLLRTARGRGEHIASLLEANNIITNPQAFYDDPSFAAASGVRMGTQEMTRYGMKEADFATLAKLIAEIVRDGRARPEGHLRKRVEAFRKDFVEMQYCF